MNEQHITEAVYQFQLTSPSGEQFWAPYLRNDNFTQDTHVVRGLGKSHPEDIQKSVDYIYKTIPHIVQQDVTRKLIDGSLEDISMNYKGVDCSGFAYYVYEHIYRNALSKDFFEILGVPKDQVLNGAYNYDDWRMSYQISDDEAHILPDVVPMKWVIEKYHRLPVRLCNVACLISDYSSNEISHEDLLPGDIVHMQTGPESVQHIAIINSISSKRITMVHSTRVHPHDIGGVTFDEILVAKNRVHNLTRNLIYDNITFRRMHL